MARQQEKERRPGFTTAELEEIWNRWERGESSLGRRSGRHRWAQLDEPITVGGT